MLSRTTPKPRSVGASVPEQRWAIQKTVTERSGAAASEVDDVTCSTGSVRGAFRWARRPAADRAEATLTAGTRAGGAA